MRPLAAVLLAAAILLAGCGGSIEGQVKDQYGGYATKHGFDASTRNVDRVTCTHDATSRYDGWCRVHPKGFRLTYDVPYKDGRVLWGDSGVLKAPGSGL
jgi:hypothetical protein